MAEKAKALNVVVSDKGKKATRIGTAFISEGKNPPLSITISVDALKEALANGTVSAQPFRSNPQYPDQVLDGKNVVRMAGFPKGPKKTAQSNGGW